MDIDSGLLVLESAVDKRDTVGIETWFRCTAVESYLQDILRLLLRIGRTDKDDVFEVLLQNVKPYMSIFQEDDLFRQLLLDGTSACLEHVLKSGYDVNKTFDSTISPLESLIVRSFQVDKIELLLRYGADVNRVDGSRPCFTALYRATAIDENMEVIPILLKYGADVNLPTGYVGLCQSAVHLAVQKANVKALAAFFDHGADLRAKTIEGESIPEVSLRHPPVLCYFLRRNILTGSDRHYLLLRALLDLAAIDLESIELLLQSGSRCSFYEWKFAKDTILVSSSLEIKISEVEYLLNKYCFQPRLLRDLVCFKIRKILFADFDRCVSLLPVPDIIKRYVKLEQYFQPHSTSTGGSQQRQDSAV